MNRIRVMAIDKVMYDKRDIAPGQQFDCEEKDILPLKLCGKIRDLAPEEPLSKKRYNRRDMQAAS